jgi:hypothetical protein
LTGWPLAKFARNFTFVVSQDVPPDRISTVMPGFALVKSAKMALSASCRPWLSGEMYVRVSPLPVPFTAADAVEVPVLLVWEAVLAAVAAASEVVGATDVDVPRDTVVDGAAATDDALALMAPDPPQAASNVAPTPAALAIVTPCSAVRRVINLVHASDATISPCPTFSKTGYLVPTPCGDAMIAQGSGWATDRT